MDSFSQQPVVMEVTGKPIYANLGVISPSFFGQTKLQLTDKRIVEKTTRIIARRYCEVPLAQVDSAEISEDGNPALLVLGFITLSLFGLGLIFLILYFFMKNRYFIIRSGSNIQAFVIQGADGIEKCTTFMDTVLRRSEDLRNGRDL